MNLQEQISRMKSMMGVINEKNNTRRTDIDRFMDTSLFDELYDQLIGKQYFKFEDYSIWFDSDGGEITDDSTNRILDSLQPTDRYSSFEKWKDSNWYYETGFPFSNKDWSMVNNGDEKFKWVSTGHKSQEEPIFNRYLKKYGSFIVLDLTK